MINNRNINKFKIFKVILIAFVITLITSSYAVYATDQSEYAKNVAKEAMFSLNGNLKELDLLKDENASTTYSFEEASSIKIKSEKPIASVYIVFDKSPEIWEMTFVDGQSSPNGRYGFLHDFVKLSEPCNEFNFKFEANTKICDIYLYTEGTLPESVQVWEPPYEDADMLLLPTHADDEFLYFGGIIPYYAGEMDKKVQVAYLTNHEAEPYRQHELLNALWNAGLHAYPVIPPFKDYYAENVEKAKTLYDTEAILEYQVNMLRRFRPEVVVGHSETGEYGHGVHILNTELLKQSIEFAKDELAMPDSLNIYGTFDVPKVYLHSYAENQIVMDIDKPLTNFNNKTAFYVAKESFAMHKSQTKHFNVEKSGRDDCRKFGLYKTTVGQDIQKNDLFENITEEIINPPVSSQIVSSDIVSSDDMSSSESVSSESSSSNPSEKESKGPFSWLLILAGMLLIIFGIRRTSRSRSKINMSRRRK